MERTLIRSPFVLFVTIAVTSGLLAMSFPQLAWLAPPVLIALLGFVVFAAFFTTRYTTYHRGMNWLLKLTFCLFSAFYIQAALDQWLSQRTLALVTIAYFVLLTMVYLFSYRKERQLHWSEFGTTLESPSLVIENGKVRRIVRLRATGKRNSSFSGASSIGAGAGVAVLGLIGAMFGEKGKELLLLVLLVALMVSPLFLLRFIVPYSVGIREVRKVERQRGLRFDMENVDVIQEERRKFFLARVLNRRLRHGG
jgi:putative effector of murein hydrolase